MSHQINLLVKGLDLWHVALACWIGLTYTVRWLDWGPWGWVTRDKRLWKLPVCQVPPSAVLRRHCLTIIILQHSIRNERNKPCQPIQNRIQLRKLQSEIIQKKSKLMTNCLALFFLFRWNSLNPVLQAVLVSYAVCGVLPDKYCLVLGYSCRCEY